MLKACFVEVISLMDTLFSVSIKRILNELNVDDDIKEAILENKGILGGSKKCQRIWKKRVDRAT